jgi:hypothetical protein
LLLCFILSSEQTLRLAYVDGAPGAILHTTLTLSAEAATHGMRLAVAASCTLPMVLALQNNTRALTTTATITNVSEANTTGAFYASPGASPYSLYPSQQLVYTIYGALNEARSQTENVSSLLSFFNVHNKRFVGRISAMRVICRKKLENYF